MGIQLPTINRAEPQADPSVGRLISKPLDTTGAVKMQSEAVEGLVKAVGKGVVDYQMEAADTKATAASNEYTQFLYEKMNGPNGAKYQKGDPTPVMKSFDDEAAKKYQEILLRNPDAPGMTVTRMKQEIGRAHV